VVSGCPSQIAWRKTRQAYRIWISEIILQQTRVEQGLPYYYRFIRQFPDVKSLARASSEKVLKVWQGLGYYSRAQNLHETARQIVKEYKGQFPKNYDELIRLKGIGPYTAAAIASFAFNRPHAVVDGNVMRLLARLFAIVIPVNSPAGKKIIQQKADELLDIKNPAIHNQAMIEAGSILCKPLNPLCNSCPVNDQCLAFQTGTASRFPVKLKKNDSPVIHLHYFILTDGKKVLVTKRPANGIWKGLYDFPKIEKSGSRKIGPSLIKKELAKLGVSHARIRHSGQPVKHVLSHRRLHAGFSVVILPSGFKTIIRPENGRIIGIDELKKIPVPRLIEKIIAGAGWSVG
jgi:A/G-specific adenine glycosylase